MTRSVVTSACHGGRVVAAPVCPACVLRPVEGPPADPTPCERCKGSRVVAKLCGPILCTACRPPRREPCRYCGDTGTMRGGEPCEGIDCVMRGRA